MSKVRHVVVTGASGFIGRYVVRALLQGGHKVLALTQSKKSGKSIPKGARIHITDYSYEDLIKVCSDYDSLIHLAAQRSTRQDDPDAFAPFLTSMSNMLEVLLRAAKQCGFTRVITASSIAVYSQENQTPFSEADIPRPLNSYGLSKLVQEYAADIWARKYKIPTAHLRLSACYGFGEKTTPALMKFATQAQAGKHISVTNGGRYMIDQVYVEDVAQSFLLTVQSTASGAFNIGGGKSYSVLEIAKTINKVYNNTDGLHIIDDESPQTLEPLRHSAIKRANDFLHWAPIYTLEKGIKAMREASKADL